MSRRMRPEDGDVSKLPVWAQSRIEGLERDLSRAQARFEEMGHVLKPPENPERGHISYGDWQREVEIPGGDKVTFHFGEGMEIQVRFNDDSTELLFQASSTLQILLQASNTLRLMIERDRVREHLLDARAARDAANIIARPKEYGGDYKKSRKS